MRAYLAEAAGHCGECHSPRNLMQAIDNRRKFAGGQAEGWTAFNITSDKRTGNGDWSPTMLEAYLSAGHAAGKGSASGPMGEAVEFSLSHLVPSDTIALVTYLRTIPPVHSDKLPDTLAGPASSSPRIAGNIEGHGKQTFEGACASCHAWSGTGALREQAALTGSRTVNDPAGTNVVQMVLAGTGPVSGDKLYMPGLARTYSDQEIADVANYVTGRFGSAPSHLTAREVAKLRASN